MCRMFFAAAFMAGGYGIMCSVSQSTAMLLADKEQRGLANSTYYIGLDLGMTLGPAIGGMLYGHVPIALFYPVLLITLPLAGAGVFHMPQVQRDLREKERLPMWEPFFFGMKQRAVTAPAEPGSRPARPPKCPGDTGRWADFFRFRCGR